METFGLNSSLYIVLSLALYFSLLIVLFFSIKSNFRSLFLAKTSELISKIDSGKSISIFAGKVNSSFWQPAKSAAAVGLNSIAKFSSIINRRQKWLIAVKFGESFDIAALVLRKLYTPEPYVVISYSAILFVVFYFILTIF